MSPGLCLDSGEFIPAAELNRKIDMEYELPTLPQPKYTVIVYTPDEVIAYAQQVADQLQQRITELTESLETASAACIMLKQQKREGWAQPEPLSDVQIFKAYTYATGKQRPNMGRSRSDLLVIARALEAAMLASKAVKP